MRESYSVDPGPVRCGRLAEVLQVGVREQVVNCHTNFARGKLFRLDNAGSGRNRSVRISYGLKMLRQMSQADPGRAKPNSGFLGPGGLESAAPKGRVLQELLAAVVWRRC
jgi:hypothetical protein